MLIHQPNPTQPSWVSLQLGFDTQPNFSSVPLALSSRSLPPKPHATSRDTPSLSAPRGTVSPVKAAFAQAASGRVTACFHGPGQPMICGTSQDWWKAFEWLKYGDHGRPLSSTSTRLECSGNRVDRLLRRSPCDGKKVRSVRGWGGTGDPRAEGADASSKS